MNHPALTNVLPVISDACRVARAVQRDLERVRKITKDDRSPVTVADFAVQAIVSLGLHEIDSKVRIVGEEKADALRSSDQTKIFESVVDAVRLIYPSIAPSKVLDAIDACNHDATADAYWALDPIDGTKGFLRGQQYAIALGWIEHDFVTFGVMGCPNLPHDQSASLETADSIGTMYAAARNEGAWELPCEASSTPPERIAVSTFDEGGPVRTCESVEAAHSKQSDTARILDTLGAPGEPVRLDSQCKYAVVARGQAHAYLRLPTRKDYVEKIWDHAAGSVIASEAGAIVSDITGSPLDFTQGRGLSSNQGIICASPNLHDRIIGAIEQLGIAAAV